MNSKAWVALILILAIIIVVLAWILFTTPVPTTPATGSTSSPQTAAPLHAQVTVTTPTANATLSHSFEVAGTAPNQWFNEAVFPIQVRDPNDNLIGASQGQAQGDWTQPGLVTFTSHMTVDSTYEGPANLILLKDNPSGLPQNDDSVTVPIVIQ